MSKPRGKSSEFNLFKPNRSSRSPAACFYNKNLKSKISQFEQKLKNLKLIRNYKTQYEPCVYSSGKLRLMKTTKDIKGDQISNSFNTETTCLDLSSVDCQDYLKSSDSYRKLKIDLKAGEGVVPVSLGMTLRSPLSKILESDQDLEKTPAFKVNSSILRNRRNAGCSSSKKKRTSSLKKPLKMHKDSSANKENSENCKISPNSKVKSEQNEENILKMLANQEKIFKSKISELSFENELKIKKLEEKIMGLKNENQRLVKLVSGGSVNNQVKIKRFDYSDYTQECNTLLTVNEEMKNKGSKCDKENKINLCTKCKAFVNTNNDLNTKIERIREFINND